MVTEAEVKKAEAVVTEFLHGDNPPAHKEVIKAAFRLMRFRDDQQGKPDWLATWWGMQSAAMPMMDKFFPATGA